MYGIPEIAGECSPGLIHPCVGINEESFMTFVSSKLILIRAVVSKAGGFCLVQSVTELMASHLNEGLVLKCQMSSYHS